MSVFVDTSAIIGVLVGDDEFHGLAGTEWTRLVDHQLPLVTSNYILLETTVLLRTRIGMGPVRLFQRDIEPMLDIVWIDEQTHRQAAAALAAADRRTLSLVDMTSFAVMDRLRLDTAFTFDGHFSERGYSVLPSPSV